MNVTMNAFILSSVNDTLVRFIFAQLGARIQTKPRLQHTENQPKYVVEKHLILRQQPAASRCWMRH